MSSDVLMKDLLWWVSYRITFAWDAGSLPDGTAASVVAVPPHGKLGHDRFVARLESAESRDFSPSEDPSFAI